MYYDDLSKLISDIQKTRIQNSNCLEIGELLNKLNQFDDSRIIKLSNESFLDGDFDSYRGYYSDLGLDFSNKDNDFNTVADLKNLLTKALDTGIMHGYKGGEFPIEYSTLVWLANSGTTHNSLMVVDLIELGGQLYLIGIEDDL